MYKVCCGVAKIYEGLCTLFSSLIICVVFPSLKAKVIMVKDHEDWNTTTQHHIFIIINERDIGGHTQYQYREKNWQISKYRVENQWNTDTAFMTSHAYLK